MATRTVLANALRMIRIVRGSQVKVFITGVLAVVSREHDCPAVCHPFLIVDADFLGATLLIIEGGEPFLVGLAETLGPFDLVHGIPSC